MKKTNKKPLYYATTIEKGRVITHDGDPKYAVYASDIKKIQKRAGLWHDWLLKNIDSPYDSLGVVKPDIYVEHKNVCQEFMSGKKVK